MPADEIYFTSKKVFEIVRGCYYLIHLGWHLDKEINVAAFGM